VIIISGGSLDSFYEQTLQYLRGKYHSYPSSLLGTPISESEKDDISYRDAMARQSANEASIPSDVPIGKLVR